MSNPTHMDICCTLHILPPSLSPSERNSHREQKGGEKWLSMLELDLKTQMSMFFKTDGIA